MPAESIKPVITPLAMAVADAEPTASHAPPAAPDAHEGQGGSYVMDPATGIRTRVSGPVEDSAAPV